MMRCKAILYVTVSASALFWGNPVRAQQSTQPAALESGGIEEIIVTARKREESILKVPVVETAIPRAQLERLQVTEVADLPTIVPGLMLGQNILTIGTQLAIRGIGSTAYDQGVDSSVSLNIDGLSLGNGLAFQTGLFDLAQVEVLKGPQSLFYGKAASAGVIALRTADPTEQFELIGRGEYEFESITPLGQLIISGPVTDTLKLRLASQYSTSKGFWYNDATALAGTGAINPAYNRAPHDQNYMIRLTALWDPFDQFTARLKLNYDQDEANDASPLQLSDCPDGIIAPFFGIPFIGGGENCVFDRTFRTVASNPANFPGIPNNGYPYLDLYQEYGTLELNYRPVSYLTLSSTSGYYHEQAPSSVNAISTTYAGTPVVASNHQTRHDFTEELRLNSDFSKPVNFTVGGFYEDGQLKQNVVVIGNTALGLPGLLQNGLNTVDIKDWSAFGQLRWKILQQLELAAGDRWSDETRSQNPINLVTGLPVPTATPSIHSDVNMPEITLTYTPTDDLTLFASYKKGFKSGSFSVGTPVLPGLDNSFGDEKVHGEEAGLKSLLFNRQLALNVATYYYDYSGLQVGAVQPPINGTIVTRTVNAGESRTYGLEADAAFRPQAIQRLALNGALEYNRAKYVVLNNVPCWGGQTIADGCNQNFNPGTGLYTAQNLSGAQLVRAPLWHINLGFDYTFLLASDYQLTLTNNNVYTSRFPTIVATGRPNNDNYQGSYAKSDVGLALKSPDNRWEISVIGKNIANRITAGNCTLSNIAGGVIFPGQEITGGTGRGPAGIDEALCWGDVGREVWLRLTVRPFAGRQ